ncbi:MAG: baseplate J/gp47 family protein [Chloroflexi bacterium]|nr:baseplate J/gp47 family protein [Chloroflexota bacterium]
MTGRIIYLTPEDLTPEDDVAGARDRIEWACADRVVLVLPSDKSNASVREVDFELIGRAGKQFGCEVAVVSPSWTQRQIAESVGLVTFRTVQQAIQQHWIDNEIVDPIERLSPPRRFRPNSLRQFFPRHNWLLLGLRLIVALATVAIVAAAALMIVPSAKITLTASSQSISLIVPVTLDTQIDKVDIEGRMVPARRVDVIVEDVASAPATGAKDIPKSKAKGSVYFLNVLATPYVVPKNTVVRTSSASVAVRFITLSDVEVPPGGRAEVSIEAIEEGPSGNVPANQVNSVEGLPALAVKVINTKPTEGGGNETVRSVTEDDYKLARATVRDRLLQTAVEKMNQDPEVVRNGWFVVPNTLFIADVQDETYDRFITEQADAVNLNMRLQIAGLAVAPADLDDISRAALTERVPTGFSLLEMNTERGDVAEEGTGNRTELYIVSHGIAGAEIDETEVKELVRGKTIADAQSLLLQELSLKGNPVIDVEPAWLLQYTNRLPFVILRIGIQVKRE